MEKILHVKKFGCEYQIFVPNGFETPIWSETIDGCVDAIKSYRQKNPAMTVTFKGVYESDEKKIRKMARI